MRPPLDLATLSGYWVSHKSRKDLLYISPQGLLDATIWKNGEISGFIGRWKPVQEIALNASPQGHEVLMVTDEKYCGTDGTREEHRFFRPLHITNSVVGMEILIDYAIGLAPPPNPLAVDNETLWSSFRANAKNTNYLDGGYRGRIDEADAPLWFFTLATSVTCRSASSSTLDDGIFARFERRLRCRRVFFTSLTATSLAPCGDAIEDVDS